MTEHTSEDAGEGGVVISTTTDCECVAREAPSSVATPSSQHKTTTSVTLPPRVLNEEHVSDVKKHNAQDTTLTETETLTTKANKENEYAKKPSTESEDALDMNTANEKTRMNGNLSKLNTKFSDDACTTVPHTDIEPGTKMHACECTDDNPLKNGDREQSIVTNNNMCSEYDFKSVTPDVSAEQISNTNSLRSRVSSEKSSVPSDESKHNDTINVIDYFYRSSNETFKPKIRWPDLMAQLFVHGGCIYGLILMLTSAKILTTLWAFLTIYTSGFGITAGAHRLWSHRAYKARWPLRLLLIFLFTITGQRDVYTWALDHRVHHKYSETDADPHNAKRGFFFAHVGWLFLTPHPDVVVKRAAVDMSDLEADPIVMWQKRLYIPLFALLVIGLPVFVPVYFWDETLWNSFVVNFNCRFCITLNIAFFVNSVAHMWGNRPYDRYISPVENLAVAIAALGEGWHNYHHVFPWDYKTSELGSYTFNPSTAFIDFFAKLGWAYDRKIVSPSMVARRAARSGDGTHVNVWGYGDADIEKHDLAELENMTDKVK